MDDLAFKALAYALNESLVGQNHTARKIVEKAIIVSTGLVYKGKEPFSKHRGVKRKDRVKLPDGIDPNTVV
jgi:hypothetical protein